MTYPNAILTTLTHVVETYAVPGTNYYRVFTIMDYGLLYSGEFYGSDLSNERIKERINN